MGKGEQTGQATVEFLVVFSTLLIITLTLFSLYRLGKETIISSGIEEGTSHATTKIQNLVDIVLY